MPAYCSPAHRNRGYVDRRATASVEDLDALAAQLVVLAESVDVSEVVAVLDRLRSRAGLEPVTLPPAKKPRGNASRHRWAVWRVSVEEPLRRVKYSTHTTENAADSACRRLQQIWRDHQQRPVITQWRWEVADNDATPGLSRKDADAEAARMIPTDLPMLTNDLADQFVERRATTSPIRWQVGTGYATGPPKLVPVDPRGTLTWEITDTTDPNIANRHPYIYDLLRAICGPVIAADRPHAGTLRRAIANKLAAEILDPAGTEWQLTKIELRQWLWHNGYIDKPTEQTNP